jgi:hypothetical protein
LNFDSVGTTTLDPVNSYDMDDFVWLSDMSRCHFGDHTFVNSYTPLGFRISARGGSRVYCGTAIVPGVRGFRFYGGEQWYFNDHEQGDVIRLWQDTTFHVHPNGRWDGQGMEDFMGGTDIDTYPGFAMAGLAQAGWMLSRVDANGFNVTLKIPDGTWYAEDNGYGKAILPIVARPRNCPRFRIEGNTASPGNCRLKRNFPDNNYWYGSCIQIGGFHDDYSYGGHMERVTVDEILGLTFESDWSGDWDVTGILNIGGRIVSVDECHFDDVWLGFGIYAGGTVSTEDVYFWDYVGMGFSLDSGSRCWIGNAVISEYINPDDAFIDIDRHSYCRLEGSTNALNWYDDSFWVDRLSIIDADDDIPGYGSWGRVSVVNGMWRDD